MAHKQPGRGRGVNTCQEQETDLDINITRLQRHVSRGMQYKCYCELLYRDVSMSIILSILQQL